jgi:Secretion system C-terminal sorting domain/Reeler domain
MHNTILLGMLLFCALLFLGNQTGAFPENTGAPNELTCGRAPCHNIPANTGSANINIRFGDSIFRYQSDSVYRIRVRIANPQTAKNGFQILALNASAQNTGQWILDNAGKTQIISGIGLPSRKYVTHTEAGNQQSEWFVNWKAAKTGVGDVIFYASVLSSNNDGTNSGDQLYITSARINYSTTSTGSEPGDPLGFKAYPNPARDRFWIEHNRDDSEYDAVLANCYGAVLQQFKVVPGLNPVAVSALPAGVYLLKIRDKNSDVFHKFLTRF